MAATEQHPTAERHVGYLPLSQVERAAVNPKRHAGTRIAASISRFGLGELPLLDERTGRIVAGHGRLDQLQAAYDRGDTPPEGVRIGEDGEWHVPLVRGWASRSDDDARAYLVASNRTTELGGWDETELADLMVNLAAVDADLAVVAGYDADELTELLARVDALNPDDDLDDEDGEERSGLLGLAGVVLTEPRHQTGDGQVWSLGDRHHLVITDVFTGHPLWAPLLTTDTVFLPYPTVLAPFAERGRTAPLLLVQPDPYIAGNMLDKWQHITGDAPELLSEDA